MTHYSQVSSTVFGQIVSGSRQIEPRLYDAAHRAIKPGDLILFQNRDTKTEALAKVVGLLRFNSFVELFNAYPASRFGVVDEREILSEMQRTYTPEQEAANGVLGIKLHLLNKMSDV